MCALALDGGIEAPQVHGLADFGLKISCAMQILMI
jgi:hypothetical protein